MDKTRLPGHRPIRHPRTCAGAAALALSLLCGHGPARADGAGNADVTTDGCMEELTGSHVNCKANDIRVAGVALKADGTPDLEITDPCDYPGDTVTFTATFDVELNAQARHDIGIFFATDGDSNGDGAVSGNCTIATPAYAPDPPWLDLDGTNDPFPGGNTPSGVQDTCGDIDDAHNPLHPRITLTAVCKDPDGDGFLNLPVCTSWRQPGANELCTSPTGAFPGAPSKCNCDEGFQVPVPVPPASLSISKKVRESGTADPFLDTIEVYEPGVLAEYQLSITNDGIDPNNAITISDATDELVAPTPTMAATLNGSGDCTFPVMIDAGDTYTCTFTRSVTGNPRIEQDRIRTSGTDSRGNVLSGQDDAAVRILDVTPGISVTKTASPTQVQEPGGPVSFGVTVANNNSVSSDPVTIDSLVDDVHGDLNGQGDCSVPQTIASGASYSCSFTATVSGNAGYNETDKVTAAGADDEGNPVMASDSANVMVVDVPSMIDVTKTASPGTVDEPGASVTFSVTVDNTSAVDSVVISSLMDDLHGDLNGQGDCATPQLIASGGSYSCSFSAFVGSPNTLAGGSETDTVTASGTDDDGQPVSDADTATVNVANVAPEAALTKTATMADVTFEVKVTNNSNAADPLDLTVLDDDVYGDVADATNPNLVSTNCSVPQTIQPGQSYTCQFVAKVTASQTDTVTGTLSDDDGSAPIDRSDTATVELK